MHTIFACLGGTGTQIGRAIGTLYPLLKKDKEEGLIDEPFDMFIIDKDTNSGIFKGCVGTHERYEQCYKALPFNEPLEPFYLGHDVYQQMQGATGLLRDGIYTLKDIIGEDKFVLELASMCWSDEKIGESLRDGNNRDPSRGALDAAVCLNNLEKSSFCTQIDKVISERSLDQVRLVILGGATGGMGSSLIVPLVDRIKVKYPKLRVDLVILGTYFTIPQRKDEKNKSSVDNIGTSKDSFYRAADQIRELADKAVNNENRVYYAAMPFLDSGVSGEVFEKNGADRRAHLVELCAALAAFEIADKKPGFYQTVLPYNLQSSEAENVIRWDDIPGGNKIYKKAARFMNLLSLLSSRIYPVLNNAEKSTEIAKYRSELINRYFKKKDQETIDAAVTALRAWIQNTMPYFKFWNDIQEYSKLGFMDSRNPVLFFDREQMTKLKEELDSPQMSKLGSIPFIKEKWNDILGNLKPDPKKVAAASDSVELLKLLIEDVYRYILNDIK
jgi:DNA-binding PadR family transcriptional regulator